MEENFYESDKAVAEYLLFHYGSKDEFYEQGIGTPEALEFAFRCGKLHSKIPKGCKKRRALDLGCAVGRASFELSSEFNEVIGIDFAQALINSAQKMVKEGKATIPVTIEGDIMRDTNISIPLSSKPERIEFQQGDAMELSPALGQFDFILMANLIDRLPDPAHCLRSIHQFITNNGVLAITSPYTWLEEYTPKKKWLGGYYEDEQPIHSFDTLKKLLSKEFNLLEEENMPFLIREHNRKNQYSVAHATIWQKKNAV